MSPLLQLLQQTAPLTDEEIEAVQLEWNREITLKRKDFLIEYGKVERSLYFVKSGTLRIYYAHKTEETCVGFGHPNTILCAFPSLIRNEPSIYYIQALKPCELIQISKERFYFLKEKYPNINDCWQMMIEHALLGRMEREKEMLTLTPEERAQNLLKRSPHIFQLFPKKYIASYLGMAPETLSRIAL